MTVDKTSQPLWLVTFMLEVKMKRNVLIIITVIILIVSYLSIEGISFERSTYDNPRFKFIGYEYIDLSPVYPNQSQKVKVLIDTKTKIEYLWYEDPGGYSIMTRLWESPLTNQCN